jgi:hypothetical protein
MHPLLGLAVTTLTFLTVGVIMMAMGFSEDAVRYVAWPIGIVGLVLSFVFGE